MAGIIGNGFIDRIRARWQRRRAPAPMPISGAEQAANAEKLDALAGAAGRQYEGAYGALGDAKARFDALAAGQGPSVAQAQLEAASGRNIAAQMALAGQARGGNLAQMANQAQATGAGMAMQTQQQMAELRAEEQLAAMNASAGLAGQMAGMANDRQMGTLGMGQQAMAAQADRTMAWGMAQQDQAQRRRESNLGFGLGLLEAGTGLAGTFSDRTLKRDIKPAKSPIAMLLLAEDDEDDGGCPHCGRPDCQAEHETESMGSEPPEPEAEGGGLARRLAARKALGKLRPYEYEYNDEGRARGMPEGKVVGVMAQDLELSEAGRALVDDEQGRKWIDGRKALSLLLAGAADHEARLRAVEKGKVR